jgi:hypothetical protein
MAFCGSKFKNARDDHLFTAQRHSLRPIYDGGTVGYEKMYHGDTKISGTTQLSPVLGCPDVLPCLRQLDIWRRSPELLVNSPMAFLPNFFNVGLDPLVDI